MKTFEEMPIPEALKQALLDIEFKTPTKVQSATIPVALEGQDLMACAQTGSGKTAAFGIPMIAKLMEDPKSAGLVLAPTRELALQIADFFKSITSPKDGFRITLLVGGSDIRKQFKSLQKKPRIVVATPGRLIDHLRRNTVQLNNVSSMVLDEGDRMLDMGFAPQLDDILKHVPKDRHTSLFTATMPDKVQKLAQKYLKKPKKMNVGEPSKPVSSIKQAVAKVTFHEKDDRIIDELNQRTGSIIIFARTKNRTNILAKNLDSYGFSVDLIHGDRTQGQRNRAISNFKSGRSRILCATDVAARGIDVPQVEHVINFDLPMMEEDYVHRIGRTARNGAEGEALSFVMPDEVRTWNSLARKYKILGVELEDNSKGGRGKKKSFSRGGGGRSFGSGGGRRGSGSYEDRAERGGGRFGKKRSSGDRDEGRSFGKKRSSEDREEKSFGKKRFNDDKPFGKFSKRPKKTRSWDDDSSDDRFSDRKKSSGRSWSKDSSEENSSRGKKKSWGNSSSEGKSFEGKKGSARSWSKTSSDEGASRGKKKSWGNSSSEGKSFGSKKSSARSWTKDSVGEDSFRGKKSSKKKSFAEDQYGNPIKKRGEKKSFSKKSGGFKKSRPKNSSRGSARA